MWEIPNVKHNHIEKTIHPAQFPVELVERLVLSMTDPGDAVFDPYMGVEIFSDRGGEASVATPTAAIPNASTLMLALDRLERVG